jgi:acyl dehydratase
LKGVSREALKAAVGKTRESDVWLRVTQDMINAFADATFDHQFIHVDPERARRTPFRTTVAHGFLTLSLLPHLLEPIQLIPENVKMGINYGLNRVRFPTAVPVNAEIKASATLLSITEPSPGRVLLTQEVVVLIKGVDKPALVAESLAMFVIGPTLDTGGDAGKQGSEGQTQA